MRPRDRRRDYWRGCNSRSSDTAAPPFRGSDAIACPKTASRIPERTIVLQHATGPGRLHPRPRGTRRTVRRCLLRRNHVDRNLLPPNLSCARHAAQEPALLLQRRGRRAGGLSAVPSVPAGVGARLCPHRRRSAAGPVRSAPHRLRSAQRTRRRRTRPLPRRQRQAAAARDAAGVGRHAHRARANASIAARQAAAHGYAAAHLPGCVRERIPEPAALQRALPRPLSSQSADDAS